MMIPLYRELLGSATIVARPLPALAGNLTEAVTEMSEGPTGAELSADEALAGAETATVPAVCRRIPVLMVHGEQDEPAAFDNAESQAEAIVDLQDIPGNQQRDGSVHAQREFRHGHCGDITVGRDDEKKPLAILMSPKNPWSCLERWRFRRAVLAKRLRPLRRPLFGRRRAGRRT